MSKINANRNEINESLKSTYFYTQENFKKLTPENRKTLSLIIQNLSSSKEATPITKDQLIKLNSNIDEINDPKKSFKLKRTSTLWEKVTKIFHNLFYGRISSGKLTKQMDEIAKVYGKIREKDRENEYNAFINEHRKIKNYAEKELDGKISALFTENDQKLISLKLPEGKKAKEFAQDLINDLKDYSKLPSEQQSSFRGHSFLHPEKDRVMMQHFGRQAMQETKETKKALEYLILLKESNKNKTYFISSPLISAIKIMEKQEEIENLAEILTVEVKGSRGIDINKFKLLLEHPNIINNKKLKNSIIEKAEIIQIQYIRERQLGIVNLILPPEERKTITSAIYALQDMPNNGNHIDGINGIRKIGSFPDEGALEEKIKRLPDVNRKLYENNLLDVQFAYNNLQEIRVLKSPNDISNKEVQDLLSSLVGAPIDSDRNFAIPQKIHRFWSGGKMPEGAMQILIESANKTEGTPWKNILWYSTQLEKQLESSDVISEENKLEREQQRMQLKDMGYEVRAIEDMVQTSLERTEGRLTVSDLNVIIDKAAFAAIEGGPFRWDGIKHLSDLARLMYLNEVGGHHFDVDMGLGNMDLNRTYYHNDSLGLVPLLGSVTATSEDPIAKEIVILENHEHDFTTPNTLLAAQKVVTQACDLVGMLNGMISSRAGNPHMQAAIEILRSDALIPKAELSSGMSLNKILMGGNLNSSIIPNRGLAVPIYILDIQHLSPESDNR